MAKPRIELDIRFTHRADGKVDATLYDVEGGVIVTKTKLKDEKAGRASILRWLKLRESEAAQPLPEPPHISKFRHEVERLRRLADDTTAKIAPLQEQITVLRMQATGYNAAARELEKIVAAYSGEAH